MATVETRVLLALGSSIEDRRANLRRAIAELESRGLRIDAISPVVETPAMLPVHAESEWNVAYLNLVLDARIRSNDIETINQLTKEVQTAIAPKPASRWEPRAIDIDLLCVGTDVNELNGKTIPNTADITRPFNITPLLHLQPSLKLAGLEQSVIEMTRSIVTPVPLWMGVVNLTPDSFSGGSSKDEQLADWQKIDRLIEDGAHIIDIGGESVRPGAAPVTADKEWLRIETTLHALMDHLSGDPLAPRISVDTRHAATAARAIDAGVGLINDVSGLCDPAMLRLAADSSVEFVVMHSLSVPPSADVMLKPGEDPIEALKHWFEKNCVLWEREGIDLDRLLLDPGICFGKNRLQSQEIMRRISQVRALGCRTLVGHSRKGFLRSLEQREIDDRELETLVASLAMVTSGVDVLRVHDVEVHSRGWLAWSHVASQRSMV